MIASQRRSQHRGTRVAAATFACSEKGEYCRNERLNPAISGITAEGMMMINFARTFACLALVTCMLVPNRAMPADDKAVLADLNEVKAAFDIKEVDGKLLLSRLEIIDETRESLIAQG